MENIQIVLRIEDIVAEGRDMRSEQEVAERGGVSLKQRLYFVVE
jgi:hypothetical protein